MAEKSSDHLGARVGGTIVAIIISVFVLFVVTIVAGIVFTAVQYYLGSMRFEAAAFIGGIVGGVTGVYAARIACDSVVRSYSLKSIFVVLILLCIGSVAGEILKGIEWSSIGRLAQTLAIAGTAWAIFWKNDD